MIERSQSFLLLSELWSPLKMEIRLFEIWSLLSWVPSLPPRLGANASPGHCTAAPNAAAAAGLPGRCGCPRPAPRVSPPRAEAAAPGPQLGQGLAGPWAGRRARGGRGPRQLGRRAGCPAAPRRWPPAATACQARLARKAARHARGPARPRSAPAPLLRAIPSGLPLAVTLGQSLVAGSAGLSPCFPAARLPRENSHILCYRISHGGNCPLMENTSVFLSLRH